MRRWRSGGGGKSGEEGGGEDLEEGRNERRGNPAIGRLAGEGVGPEHRTRREERGQTLT